MVHDLPARVLIRIHKPGTPMGLPYKDRLDRYSPKSYLRLDSTVANVGAGRQRVGEYTLLYDWPKTSQITGP